MFAVDMVIQVDRPEGVPAGSLFGWFVHVSDEKVSITNKVVTQSVSAE